MVLRWSGRRWGGIAVNLDSMRKPIKGGLRKSGEIPYYGASGIVDYVKDYIFDDDLLLVSEDGANLLARSTPIAFSISGKSWVNNHAHVLRFETYDERRYIEYYLNNLDLIPYISGAAQPKLNKKNLNSILIPIPCPDNPKKSLEIQAEIVRILDTFTELTAELNMRKNQYNYYRNQLLSFEEGDVEWKSLGDVAVIGTGNHDTKDAIEDGDYIFYARGRDPLRLNVFDFDETAIITAGDGAGVGKVFHYAQGKYALHQRAYRIVPGEVMEPRFIYHFIVAYFYQYIQKASVSSSVTSLRRPMFLNFPIPVPSLKEQARIVAILDKFDALTNSITEGLPREIELHQQQYEYYRDLLLSFPKPEEVAA